MDHSDDSVIENDMNALREGIKTKYRTYYRSNRDRFPDFDFNTNRANYQPLKDSFEVEFYEVRSIDRVNNNLHIPSTNTLALIFSDPDFVPGKKILNTCRSYAELKPKDTSTVSTLLGVITNARGRKPFLLVSFLLLAGFVIYGAILQLNKPTPPSGLLIYRPYHGQGVDRLLTVSGKVAHADTVWLIVHPVSWRKGSTLPVGGLNYYVQPPIKVNTDGTWKGVVFIGSVAKENIGIRFQLRAFVHPDEQYRVIEEFERDVFGSWPEAELSTEAIEVVRSK